MITNRYNLPEHLIDLVSERKPVENRYSVTELLNSTKEIILRRRYGHLIVTDLSDHIDRLFGTAFHTLMEYDSKDEVRLEHTLPNGVTVSGRADRIVEDEVIDYKTAKMSFVAKGDFSSWEDQGLSYAWLARKRGIIINRVKIIALLKDYSKMNKLGIESAVYEHVINVTTDDMLKVEKRMLEKTNELLKYKDAHIDDLPEPLPHELWYTGDKYAVVKPNASRALKVFEDKKEAEIFAALKGANVELRKGENFKLIYDDSLAYLFNIKEEK